jgi:protein-disulfide isomerase
MSKQKVKESKSNTPMLIIVGVLVVAALGGWWFYSSSKPRPAANSNTATNTAANRPKTNTIPPNAPPGAQPPHQTGNPAAAVRIEEFADFQCGACATANPMMNEIKSMYGSRIHFVFRHYPLSIAAHAKAYDAAVAAEAAGMQGKFWDMQNLLFQNQQAWSTSEAYKQMWKDYAGRIGIDVARWENDVIGIAAKGRVDADLQRGRAIGVNSTPSVYINGTLLPYQDMSVQTMKTIIDAELLKGSQPAAETGQPAAPANAPK